MIVFVLVIFIIILIYHKPIEKMIEDGNKRANSALDSMPPIERAVKVTQYSMIGRFIVTLFFLCLAIIIICVFPPSVAIIPVIACGIYLRNFWKEKTGEVEEAKRYK